MIDLHIHSTDSDGTDNVIDILKKANEKKLDCISITDHNTCAAYQELNNIDISQYYSGKIITGIELSTLALGIPIEILGYGVNPDIIQPKLKEMYLSAEDRNLLEIQRLYDKCVRTGIKLDQNFVKNYSPKIYPSQYLHQILIQNEANKSIIEEDAWKNSVVLYRKYMSNPQSPFFIDMNDILPSLESVINLIKASKGKVFIPHIFEYRDNSISILKYLLKTYPIDGIECYYSSFTDNQSSGLVKLCKRKSLLISGGSDYHGLNKPDIDIGSGKGNLSVSSSVLINWNDIPIFYNGKIKEKEKERE